MRTVSAIAAVVAVAATVSAQGTSAIASALCTQGQFWYPTFATCLPNGGPSTTTKTKKKCPQDWYFYEPKNACAPRFPNAPLPLCPPGHWWNLAHLICDIRCKGPLEFWFAERNQCVQRYAGGSLPENPTDTTCAENWHWDSSLNSCVPNDDNDQHDPVCGPGYTWSRTTLSCNPTNPIIPPPTPSGGYTKRSKEAAKRHSKDFCPKGHVQCPVVGHPGALECVDIQNEINACGACGNNCETMFGARRTQCRKGVCEAIVCKRGHELDHKTGSCHKHK